MSKITSLFPSRETAGGLAAIVLGLMPLLAVAQAHAGENKSIQPSDVSFSDWRLNHLVRRAVLRDEQLSPYNIGVSVKDKVATMWGPIPSPDVAKRAELTIGKVPGIAVVINECQIVPAPDPVPGLVAAAVRKAQQNDPGTMIAKSVAPSAASMTGRQVVAKPGPDFVTPKPSEFTPPVPRQTPTVRLLPPESAPAPAGPEASLETIRQSDRRFKDLALDSEDGVVKINGVVPRMKDAYDLAAKLNLAPGVKQVIIGRVSER